MDVTSTTTTTTTNTTTTQPEQGAKLTRQGIRVKRDGDNYDVLLFAEDATGKLHQIQGDLVFTPVDDSGMVSHKMRMKKEDAEHLMQDLWNAGIRPEGWDLERRRFEELTAVKEAYFRDMRDIALQLGKAVSRG
jgi:hypothetical protein